jgi:hypothetical protein
MFRSRLNIGGKSAVEISNHPTLDAQPSGQQTINGPFARARENHDEREADGEEVILESFTFLIPAQFIKNPFDAWTMREATSMTTVMPNAEMRLRNPAISAIDPANSAAMARMANSAGMYSCPVNKFIVALNP